MASVALLLSAFLACQSEYTPVPKTDGDAPEDTDGDDDDDPEYRDCPDQEFPGYSGPSDSQCVVEVQTGTFTPVVEWEKTTWPSHAANNVMSQPIVTSVTDDNGDGRIDEDDVPDIVVVTYGSNYSNGGVIRAVSGDGGAEIWSIAANVQGTGGVAAGDIDDDGFVEILSLTPTTLKAYEHDGTFKWESPSIAGHINGISDVPAISDMDGDGNPEIIAGRAILRNNGSIRAVGSHGRGGVSSNVGTCAFAADLDGNGTQEVVVGNALYGPDGQTLMFNGQPDGYPAVADFDNDGQAEIVVSGDGFVRLQQPNGTVDWTVNIPGSGGSYYGGPPTIADFDGDGEPEIGVAGGSVYAVYEGNGTVLWTATTQDASSGNTGSSVFDFEGDGVAEVVYADETRLWVLSGLDGSVKLESTDHSNGTWLEYPVIADVDGDGHAEIVVPNEPQNGGHTGIRVFGDLNDTWRPGRKTWNQYAYHITNVRDDGGIPRNANLNWDTFNNFRSGDLSSGDGSSAPDVRLAQADICEIDCDDDRIVIWGHPGNEGASDVNGGATISVYAEINGQEQFLDAQQWQTVIRAGRYMPSWTFDLDSWDPRTFDRLIVRISVNDAECDETNNEIWWDGPFCN